MLKFFSSLIQEQKDKIFDKDLSKRGSIQEFCKFCKSPLISDPLKVPNNGNALLLVSEQNIIFRHLPPVNESRRRSFSETVATSTNHTNLTQKTTFPKAQQQLVSERTLALQEILALRAERAEHRKSIVDIEISHGKKKATI